jgi:hypothetical protein
MTMSADDAAIVAKLSDEQVLALTIWGESRGESIEGRIAVANVVMNRVLAQRPEFGHSIREVCLKPWQFSCWLPEGGLGNYNRVMATAQGLLLQPPVIGALLKESLWIADGAMHAQFGDNTFGASHYVTQVMYATNPPSWMAKAHLTARIGTQVYVRLA